MSEVQSLLLHQGVRVPCKVDFDDPTFGLKNEIKEGKTENFSFTRRVWLIEEISGIHFMHYT